MVYPKKEGALVQLVLAFANASRVGSCALSSTMTVTPDVPMVTGYYRYTDIWFEWCVENNAASQRPVPADRATTTM